jgi:hypothetical protein
MDPLLELPEPVKARIKAREAEAEDQFNRVKEACEQDMANARSQWGGYFDLHREQLTDAIEEARACIEAAVGISAQYVFVAHATEYRQFLRDPSKLKPILAILRDPSLRITENR